MRILQGHGAEITALSYMPDALGLATASRDQSAAIWDLASGRLARTFWSWGQDNVPVALALSPEGDRLIIGDSQGQLIVYELRDGRTAWQADLKPSRILDLTYLGDGRLIVALDVHPERSANVIQLWEPLSEGAPHEIARQLVLDSDLAGICRLGPSRLAIRFEGQETVLIWDPSVPTRAGVRLGEWDNGCVPLQATGPVRRLAGSADGRTLAAVAEGVTQIWDAHSFDKLAHIGAGRVTTLALSPDGSRLALGGRIGPIQILRLQPVAQQTLFGTRITGLLHTTEARLESELGPVHHLAFAPDGLTLAAAHRDRIVLWDVDLD